MAPAVAGTVRRTRAKLSAILIGVGFVVAACAPASNPPAFPVSQGGGFQVQVVDASRDSGRAASVAVGPNGQAAISYLQVGPAATPGVLPQPPTPGVPQAPSVVLATGSVSAAIWSRAAVSGQNAVGPAQGLATGIAGKNGLAVANVNTSLAVDAQGKHHVVWSTPSGLFSSDDVTGSAFSKPVKAVSGQTFGGSIAVGPDGVPWISYVQDSSVKAASRSGSAWKSESVAKVTGPVGLPADDTSVQVATAGEPVVAFGGGGKTMVARKSGGTWKVDAIPGSGGYAVSLALDKSGNPHVTYYDAQGTVHEADSTGPGAWQVTDLASTAAGQGSAGDPRWSTAIALDDKDVRYVTWADTHADQIMFGTNSGGKFAAQALPVSQAGANPSIAVSGDGKTLVVAWFDSHNLNLKIASSATGGLALAHPTPTLHQPSIPPPTAACKPSGTTVSVTAKNIAFDTNCLAARASTPFTIDFTNQDSGTPHNVEIFTDSSATTRLGGATGPGDTVTGPGSTTYKVNALPAGTYFFRCDIHPTQMTGTFVVAK